MPRSRHSGIEYFSCSSTGPPQVSHLVTRLAFTAPQLGQPTLSSSGCSVMILAPQFVQDIRRYSSPFSSPHRHCQSPIE